MQKPMLSFLLILALAAVLFACGKPAGGEDGREEGAALLSVKETADSRERLRYSVEEIPLPEGRRIELAGITPMGGRLYFCCRLGEQTQICSLAADGSDFQVLVPATRRIWQLRAEEDRLYALVDRGTEERADYVLAELSPEGEELAVLSLAPEEAPEAWLPFQIEVSGGRIYALGSGSGGRISLCVLDGEELLWCEDCGSASLCKLPDGRVLLSRSAEGRFVYSRIDAENRRFVPLLSLDLPLRYESGDENGLLFSYQGSVFRLQPDLSRPEKLLTLARAGLSCRQLLPEGEGFLCLDAEGRLYRLRPAGELGEEDGACVLTIAVNSEVSVYPLDKYVLEWNQSHPDCLVEIKNYYVPTGVEGDPAGFERGQDALALDVAAGKAPDMYLLNPDTDHMLLTRKGYLEDLYPYMDADPRMGREAFYQPLLRAMEFRGGLYELPGWFYVETCIAPKSLVGGPENWNYETLWRIREEEGCQTLFWNDQNRDRMFELLFLTHLYSEKLVDWETGTCFFDSPLFLHLLRAAAEFPAEEDPDWWRYSADLQQSPEAPPALLQQDWAMDCWVTPLHCWQSYGTEDYVNLGYPELGMVFEPTGSVAISAYSLHKPECWDFLSFYVSGSLEGHEECFNVLSRNMNAHYGCMVRRASTKDPYWPEDVPWENLLVKFAGIEPMMEEYLRRVDDCTAVCRQDRNVDRILRSEAARYFAGELSAEQCAANIQRRVRLYLAEQG